MYVIVMLSYVVQDVAKIADYFWSEDVNGKRDKKY